ncbi:MAG: FG-GAP repeat protein [Planctomycetota bacterium]|nr:FG-GAP repeat protein [Planctomycetota bacterium]
MFFNRKSVYRSPKENTKLGNFEKLEARNMMAAVIGDFNGDGFNDLASGIPHEDLGARRDAGAVLVRYGNGYGLNGRTELWNAGHVAGLDIREGDQFGAALIAGDFNGDGVDDLAVGIPNRDLGGITDAGAVGVIYGMPAGIFAGGLSPWRTDVFFQGMEGLQDQPDAFDRFGTSLSAGDFDGDGCDELVVGVPSESFSEPKLPEVITRQDVGAVHIIQGNATGLTTQDSQFWTPGRDFVRRNGERYNRFGSAFAVGDFDGSGRDDLAIGAPGDSFNAQPNAGAVHVIYSSFDGLARDEIQLFHQQYPSVPGLGDHLESLEAYDFFASSLASGDFNRDGKDDLAIGVPGENARAGAVHVLMASSHSGGKLTLNQNKTYRQIDVGSYAQNNNLFGYSLAVRDNGRYNELLVGVPGDSLPRKEAHGSVAVINPMHRAVDLGRAGTFIVNKTNGTSAFEYWGSSLTVGQLNRYGDYLGDREVNYEDLIVGIPGFDEGTRVDAGAFQIWIGNHLDFRLRPPNKTLSQSHFPGVSVEMGDEFGGSIPLNFRRVSTEEAIPKLESNPGARHTIYLDFNGHGTGHWLDRRRHRSPGFTLDQSVNRRDDVYGRMNVTEVAMIEDIWSTVAEDFAAFDVNVTTHRPESRRFDRVAIGGSAPGWADGAPGIHRRFDNDLTWVWPESVSGYSNFAFGLGNDLALYTGNLASHEQGHELGLDHKSEEGIERTERMSSATRDRSVSSRCYRSEYSDGGPTWNPIMGTFYDGQRTIWTQAHMNLPDSTTMPTTSMRGTETITTTKTKSRRRTDGNNELSFLRRVLGARPDDHGDSLGAATNLRGNIAVGNIEWKEDVDAFILDVTPRNSLEVRVDVAEMAPNLDLLLSIYEVDRNGREHLILHDAGSVDRLDAEATIRLSANAKQILILVTSRGVFDGDLGTYVIRTNEFSPLAPLTRMSRALGSVAFEPITSDAVERPIRISSSRLQVNLISPGNLGSPERHTSKSDQNLGSTRRMPEANKSTPSMWRLSTKASAPGGLDIESLDLALASIAVSQEELLQDLEFSWAD